MPIIKTRMALNAMRKDQELTILADDPTFDEEFSKFCFLADITLLHKKNYVDYQEYLVKLIR